MQLRVSLILASQSPRRRQLLERLGVSFRVQASGVDEAVPDNLTPYETAETLALRKGAAIAPQHPDALVLSADTIVVHANEVLNKPSTAEDARQMLRRLSNQTHEVLTGIALHHYGSSRVITAVESTKVHFSLLSAYEISAYVASGAPMDKAGAYGIQDDHGALFVEGIEGDYYNVVGLPLHRCYRLIQAHFGDLMDVA